MKSVDAKGAVIDLGNDVEGYLRAAEISADRVEDATTRLAAGDEVEALITNIDRKNRLHPFYMVYISEAKEVIVNHLSPKDLLDRMRFLCKGKTAPDMDVCREFNRLTRDGKDMRKYSDLLGDAITSIINVKEESDIDSFLSGVQGSLFTEEIRGLDDFELICFLVIK